MILPVGFCQIKCRVIVAHLFRIRALRAEPPNLSHEMAPMHQEWLLEGHHSFAI